MASVLEAAASLGALAILTLSLAACSSPPPAGAGPDYWAPPPGTWQAVFSEDFEGPANSPPSPTSWNVVVDGTPFNDEKEFYTSRPSNVMLDGAGHLVLTARQEAYLDANGVLSGQPYTSGRIESKGHIEPLYGRIEARIQLPAGKGLWPAF